MEIFRFDGVWVCGFYGCSMLRGKHWKYLQETRNTYNLSLFLVLLEFLLPRLFPRLICWVHKLPTLGGVGGPLPHPEGLPDFFSQTPLVNNL